MTPFLLLTFGYNMANALLLRRYYHIFFTQCRLPGAIEWLCYILASFASTAVPIFFKEAIPLNLILNALLQYALTYMYPGPQKLRVLLPLIYIAIIALIKIILTSAITSVVKNLLQATNSLIFDVAGLFYSVLFMYVFILIAEGIHSTNSGIRFSLKYYACFLLTPLFTFLINILMLAIPDIYGLQIHICTLLLLALNLVSFYFYRIVVFFISNKMEKEIAEEKNLYYAKQLETLTAMSESLRSYQHDLKNHAIIIDTYLTNEEYNKVREYYYDSMQRPLIEHQEFQTGNATMDSLLNYKSFEANQKGVSLDVSVDVPPKLEVRTSAIMLVFGNLLDNAIEAASHAENKTIQIQISHVNHCLILAMKNHYVGKVKKGGSRFLTIRENAILHGYGLRNIKRIIDECNGDIKFDYDENTFTVKVLLHDKTKKQYINQLAEG